MKESITLMHEMHLLNEKLSIIIASLDAFAKFLEADHAEQVRRSADDLRDVLKKYKRIERDMKSRCDLEDRLEAIDQGEKKDEE